MGVQVFPDCNMWELEEVAVATGARVRVAQPIGGNGMPNELGAGIATYEGSWDYKLNYDVVYYMLDGQLTIHCEGQAVEGRAGDVLYLERGSMIRYDATAGCKLFWVAYPGNWEEITDLPARS